MAKLKSEIEAEIQDFFLEHDADTEEEMENLIQEAYKHFPKDMVDDYIADISAIVPRSQN